METKDVFGFNYDGSWGTSGLDLWQHHDRGAMAVEVARGKAYFPEWNTVRWWLSHESFARDPQRFLANFEAGLAVFAQNGLVAIPILFNRWRDPVCDFGGVPLDHIVPGLSNWNMPGDIFSSVDTSDREIAPVEEIFGRYLDEVVGAHADDDRIYAWDMCNEPLMGPYGLDKASPIRAAELLWLTWVRDKCRAAGAKQLLTIGNYPDVETLEVTAPLCDVLSFHPYYIWSEDAPTSHLTSKASFERYLDECATIARDSGKGLIANETVTGARDDAKHVEIMRYSLGELRKRKIGFTIHALSHSLVADLHSDDFGPVGPLETMHFIEADGSLRAGHEAFNEFSPR